MPLSLSSFQPYDPYIEVFERGDNLYDWRLVAGNGEIMCSSYQGYTSESDAKRAVGTAMELFPQVSEIRSV